MSALDAERLNLHVDRLREAGWQEAAFETWVRTTARDITERAVTGPGHRVYLMGPTELGDTDYRPSTYPVGAAYAQVSIRWPWLTASAGEHTVDHLTLAVEPLVREIAMRELGRARAQHGLAGT